MLTQPPRIDPERLEQLAREMWRCLKIISRQPIEQQVLSRFPDQCCMHASILFAVYLFDHDLGESSIQCAERDDKVHWWVAIHGLIADLTCGQFDFRNGDLGQIFVGDKSDWHHSWAVRQRHVCDSAFAATIREDPVYQPLYQSLLTLMNSPNR